MGELILLGERKEEDKVYHTHGQDIRPILEENARRRKNSDADWASDPDMKQAASIPMAVWLLWESTGITNDKKELLKAIERNKEYKTTEKQLI